jgi:hypothetical protein
MNMKSRNVIIIFLVIMGIIGFSVIELSIKPAREKSLAEYAEKQKSPLTHDYTSIAMYKNKYMGDHSNLINLNRSLPLSEVPNTFESYPKTFTWHINFKENAAAIQEEKLKLSLLYNSTANFALVDNLQVLVFNFQDKSYTAKRVDVEAYLQTRLTSLNDTNALMEDIQKRLSDKSFADAYYKAVINKN